MGRRRPAVFIAALFAASLSAAPTPAIAAPAESLRERVRLTWTARLPHREPGYGMVLGGLGAPSDWVEPSLAEALGIGFDARSPRTTNWFDADGNIYGRPEREVSLHWRGREIANRRAPVDLAGEVPVEVDLRAVVGGAEVTVRLAGQTVYDAHFVPDLRPLDASPRFGGGARIADLAVRASGARITRERPVRVPVFRRELNDRTRHRWSAEADFGAIPASVGRVVATLRLDPTPAGLDPWDRLAQVWIVGEDGERYELLRYITPYRRAWEWRADVTDLLPLMRGRRKVEAWCETWGEGWSTSLDLHFYPGRATPEPIAVQNLWNGDAVLGQAAHPLPEFFRPIVRTAPAGATGARFRAIVTGHGMDPNARNAAEFLALWRELDVNGRTWRNTLWKDDNDLNPCRPQGGTWKFDRAGWAPGDVVAPWTVDVTPALGPDRRATFGYRIEPYENPTPAPGNPARHVVGTQVVWTR